jgi:hypothetical protein
MRRAASSEARRWSGGGRTFLASCLALLMLSSPAAAQLNAGFILDNGLLRFGEVVDASVVPVAPLEESVNVGGTLNAPYYFNATEEDWYRLTFSQKPLDFAVGAGRCVGPLTAPPTNRSEFEGLAAGECFWHRNLALAVSDSGEPDYFPHYNAGTTDTNGPSTRGGLESFSRTSTVVNGVGVITVSGEFTLTPPPAATYARFAGFQTEYRFKVEHRYELRANERFLRARTTLTNLTTGPDATAENVNIWIGTRDDYIGPSGDSNVKQRGVVADGVFTPLGLATDPSNAILVSSGDESIIFFSTAAGVDTVFARSGDAPRNRLVPVSPALSGANRDVCTENGVLDSIACHGKAFDGAYAIVLPAGDMAPGSSRAIDWFYGAGPVGAIASLVADVAGVAAALDAPTVEVPPATGIVQLCEPTPPVAGQVVTCVISQGPADFDILWRAAAPDAFVERVVRLGPDGVGTFSFTVPRSAVGQELTVELVAWTAPSRLGVIQRPVPSRVPAGEAPVVPVGLAVLGLLAAAGAVGTARRLVVTG